MSIEDLDNIVEQANKIAKEYNTMAKYSIAMEMANEMVEIRLVDYLNILESQGRALKCIEDQNQMITEILGIIGEVKK